MLQRKFITNVKWDGKTMEVEYTHERESASDTLTLTSTEKPVEAFTDALRDLVPLVGSVWGWPPERHCDIEVRGASFQENAKTGVLGGVVKGIGRADRVKGVLVMNTGNFTESDNDQPEKGFWSKDESEKVRALQRAALAYVDGERAPPDQGELFDAKKAAANDHDRDERDGFGREEEGTFSSAGGNVVTMPTKPKRERKESDPARKPGKGRVLHRASDAAPQQGDGA
jgi:hypothetical protein